MEEVIAGSVGFLALLAVVQGISEGVFSASNPLFEKLGEWQELVKRLVVLSISLLTVFGFGIDYSHLVLSGSNPIVPAVGQVLTALILAFGSSIIHRIVKK